MLAWILAVGAALCLVYYIIIVIYAGLGTSFAAVWLLLGGLMGAASFGLRYYQKNPSRIELWIPVSLITLCASGMMILLLMQILIFSRIPSTAEPELDYVIVLGAGVKPDGISKTLRLRLDKAAEYAKENPDTMFVLSGGKGDGEPEPEAVSMQRYLINRGVKPARLLLEQQSLSTLENLVYSRNLIQNQIGAEGIEHLRIGVLTSNFHLFRARMIARKQDFDDIRGIAAESDKVLFVHFCLRDSLAILKDRLMGNL
ncbi:MAG: YdcF family protein [Lachnospiraceae bacterium]|nr:YdcF family protein [Lachnospiraceae bacterium]